MIDFGAIKTLGDIPRVQARLRPDKVAMVCGGDEVTYRDLLARACRTANGLAALGVGPGARVAYLGRNDNCYFDVLFGAALVGAVTVAVNWRLAAPEVAYILDDADAAVLVMGREFAPLLAKIRGELPKLTSVFIVGGAGETGESDFGAWRDAQSTDDRGRAASPGEDVLQLYTSGTTGHPKGVQITHANYTAFWETALAAGWAAYEPDDVTLVAMPLFHVAGVNTGVLGLAQGLRCVMLADADPGLILKTLESEKVTVAFFVPALILFILQHPDFPKTDVSHLKRVFYGASPIAEDLLLKAKAGFSSAGFTQLYGMTETLGGGTYLPPEDHDPALGRLRSCGRIYPGFEIKVVDAEDREVETGGVGEIVMKTKALMRGYWKNPDATAKAVVEGWYHTGDAGYFDKDGYLYIYDRVKDMIVSGGENIYPAEVENALFGHPAVADVAVVGVPDEKWGEAVKAIVVVKPGETLDPQDLIAYAREKIAGYKLPKTVDVVKALPRNASGKVLRRELRDPYWKDKGRRVS